MSHARDKGRVKSQSPGADKIDRRGSPAEVAVQVIAIVSATLPAVGAIRNLVSGWIIDGNPPGSILRTSIQTLVIHGLETMALPAGLALVVLAEFAFVRHAFAQQWLWFTEGRLARIATTWGWLVYPPLILIGAVMVLTGPFPLTAVQVLATVALFAWLAWAYERSPTLTIPFWEVAVAVAIAAGACSVAAGVNGGRWAADYVSFAPSSQNQSGWYIVLTSEGDPVYLKRCPDMHLIVVPWSTITSIDTENVDEADTSLWHMFQIGALPPIGDVYVCPASSQLPP